MFVDETVTPYNFLLEILYKCAQNCFTNLWKKDLFKSNPANTTVSFCVPHELPVQIGVITIVKSPSPSQVIGAAFR